MNCDRHCETPTFTAGIEQRAGAQGGFYVSLSIAVIEHFLPVAISHAQSPLSFTMRDP